METDGSDAGSGRGEGEASERGHDEGFGRIGIFGFAEEEADSRTVDTGGVGSGGLGDDDAGVCSCGDVSDDALFKAKTADVDGGGALGLTEEIGDGDLLRAETFGDAYSPLATNGGAGCRRLREDATGWDVGGVETIFEIEAKTEGAGVVTGFGEGEAR